MQTQLSHTNTLLEPTRSPPLLLDLSLLLTLLQRSTKCLSTPLPDSRPTELPSKPTKLSMHFPSPLKQSLGMQTALAWHQEQLLEAQERLDQRNHNRIRARLLPITNPTLTTTTSPSAPSAPANEPIATVHLAPQLHRHHPYLSPLEPHRPGSWDKLSSIVSKPKCWSLDLPHPSTRTVKILLRFQGQENHPPNTPREPEVSNQSLPPKESRFWMYLLEDVKTEDVGNPSQYTTINQVLTCAQLRQMRE
jgi:hypothetical protein